MSRENDINAAIKLLEEAIQNGEIWEYMNGQSWPLDGTMLLAWAMRLRDYEYRYTAKPREFWVCWNGEMPENHNCTRWFPYPEYSKEAVENWDNYVHVREVIEDDT